MVSRMALRVHDQRSVFFGWPTDAWMSQIVRSSSSMAYQMRAAPLTSYCHCSREMPLTSIDESLPASLCWRSGLAVDVGFAVISSHAVAVADSSCWQRASQPSAAALSRNLNRHPLVARGRATRSFRPATAPPRPRHITSVAAHGRFEVDAGGDRRRRVAPSHEQMSERPKLTDRGAGAQRRGQLRGERPLVVSIEERQPRPRRSRALRDRVVHASIDERVGEDRRSVVDVIAAVGGRQDDRFFAAPEQAHTTVLEQSSLDACRGSLQLTPVELGGVRHEASSELVLKSARRLLRLTSRLHPRDTAPMGRVAGKHTQRLPSCVQQTGAAARIDDALRSIICMRGPLC